MRNLVIVVVVSLAACSGDDGPPIAPDAEVADAAPVPPDACTTCVTGHVFDSITLPIDAQQAESFGYDLDGDGTVDNQIGNIFSALTSAGGNTFDLQTEMTRAVDRGNVIVLASIQDCLSGQCLFTYHGSAPTPLPCTEVADPVCRRHLDGNALFSIDQPTDRFIPGTGGAGTFSGGPGQALLQLTIAGNTPAQIQLIRAHADLTGVSASGITGGKLGGAIPDASVQDELIPAMHASIAAQIAADCPPGGSPPDCGCTPDSTGETFLGIFDENTDCTVPLPEFRENALVMTLFRPDVDTDGDDVADALSVGVGVTAVAATFRP